MLLDALDLTATFVFAITIAAGWLASLPPHNSPG
jgi:hypothetical protein